MCFYGDEYPSFYREKIRVARKAHRCSECSEQIQPGQPYQYVAGHWDGEFSDFGVCARCYFVRETIAWVERGRGCADDEARPFMADLERAWMDDPSYAVTLGLITEGQHAPRIAEIARW